MAEHIERLINLQKRLLRDVAHELRSPLARLNVALELAEQSDIENQHESLNRIRRESDRLTRLISQLLLLSRLDSAPDLSHVEEVSLVSMVYDVIEDVNYEIQRVNRRIEAKFNTDAVVSCSPELLKQAVENVVRNAARYTKEGTAVEVSIERREDGAHSEVCIQVRDHGPGVPEENLADIFRAFYRVSESRETRSGGVGVGLAIAEGAMRAHKGSIRAVNAPQGGLLVELKMPCLPN